jgi:hypothetical protein
MTSASPDVGNLGGAYSSIARDSGGNPVISHYNGTALLLTLCDDPACAPGGDVTSVVDDSANVGQFTSLALAAGDIPVISYYDVTNTSLKVVRCNDPACAGGDEAPQTVDNTAVDTGQYSSLALDAADLAIISYYDAGLGDLKVAQCTDASCSTKTITPVDTAGDTGAFTSIEMFGNLPTVAYYDVDSQIVRVKRCGTLACTPAGLGNPVVTTLGLAEQNLSLAIDGSGFPVISYYDNTLTNVAVAHCIAIDCAGAASTNVFADPNGGVTDPNFTSITLDGTDFPIVAYSDSFGGGVHVGRCLDADCVTSAAFILDPASAVFTSIVLDLAGNPIISWQEGGAINDLVVTHCGDPTCNPRRIRVVNG